MATNYHKSVKLDTFVNCYIWQGMGNNCNTVVLDNVLKGEHPHVIIDPGHVENETGEPCYSSLEQSLAKDGIKVKDIGLIINTHSHPDHCEANEIISEKSGAGIAISREEDEFRTTIGTQLFTMFGLPMPQCKPSFYLKEGDLDLGNDAIRIQVIMTPGHSPGSVCLYLPAQKILIAGDVIFYMSVGRTDFPGGDIRQLKNSIERLATYDIEYIVPGHNTDPQGIIKGKDKIRRNFEIVKMYF